MADKLNASAQAIKASLHDPALRPGVTLGPAPGGPITRSWRAFGIGPPRPNDGVPDVDDVCPMNAVGLAVDSVSGRPLGDMNGDCHE